MFERHLAGFKKKLLPGERIEHYVASLIDRPLPDGVLVLTNQRICFYRRSFIAPAFEMVALNDIVALEKVNTFGRRRLAVTTKEGTKEFAVWSTDGAFHQMGARLAAALGIPDGDSPQSELTTSAAARL
jgi:hypothetical protein